MSYKMDRSRITVKELRVLAKQLGIKPIPRLKKDLVEAVEAAERSKPAQKKKQVQKKKDHIACGGAGVDNTRNNLTILHVQLHPKVG